MDDSASAIPDSQDNAGSVSSGKEYPPNPSGSTAGVAALKGECSVQDILVLRSTPDEMPVAIDRSSMAPKPFLGGYKDRATGVVYHHASCQTALALKAVSQEVKVQREVQTVLAKSGGQQASRHCATQMERPDLVLDFSRDRCLTPGLYVTADQVWARKEWAARILQRWCRGYLARKRVAGLEAARAAWRCFEAQVRQEEIAATAQRAAAERSRRLHPRTPADFALLRREVEAWWAQEMRAVDSANLEPEQRHAAMERILQKETKLIQALDRMRLAASGDQRMKQTMGVLACMAAPKRLPLRNGGTMEVETPATTRAHHLMQLYRALHSPLQATNERLDVLLRVKRVITASTSRVSSQLASLIDRETDLRARERNPKMLEGLGKRIASLFLQLVEDPDFNSEAAALHPARPPAYRHAAALANVLDTTHRAAIASC